MSHISVNAREFYVVQFIELPFEGIDDYVCVPYSWLKLRKETDNRALVAYPKDEDPLETRDRAKRKEIYNDEWIFYVATIKYESNSYNDAESWIASRNGYGPLVEEVSKVTDTQPNLSVNKKLRSANQNHTEVLNMDDEDHSHRVTKPDQTINMRIPSIRQNSTPIENVLNSLREAVSTAHNNFLSNNPQLLASPRSTGDNNVHLITSPQNIIASETSDRQNTEMPSLPIYQPSRIQHTTANENGYQNGSTLRHTTDVYNTLRSWCLRSSILDTARTYQTLVSAVEQFNAAGNAASNASPSSNLIPDVPRSPEEDSL